MIDYPHVPRSVAFAMSSRLVTLDELQTVYGLEDLYDILEIVRVDARNEQIQQKHLRKGH